MIFQVCQTKEKSKDSVPYAIGWDSIAATSTKHRQEADMDTRDMSKANAMNEAVMKIRDILNRTRIAVISTNQTREKIGSNDSEVHTPGGKAWPFIASTRIHLMFEGGSKTSLITDDSGTEIGRWVVGRIIKNKLAPPFGTFNLPIFVQNGYAHPEGYGYSTKIGIDSYCALFYGYLRGKIKSPSKEQILTTSGTWYTVDPNMCSIRKFIKKDWVNIVTENPWLWTYPYDGKYPLMPVTNAQQSNPATSTETQSSVSANGTGNGDASQPSGG